MQKVIVKDGLELERQILMIGCNRKSFAKRCGLCNMQVQNMIRTRKKAVSPETAKKVLDTLKVCEFSDLFEIV